MGNCQVSRSNGSLPSAEDLVWIYQLIHELCEIGDDSRVWRHRFLEELRLRFDAACVATYVMKVTLDPSDIGPRTPIYMDLGATDAWRKFLVQGDVTADPVTPAIMSRFGSDFTFARQEGVEDAVWYASDHFPKVFQINGWDQTCYSQRAITPPGLVDGIGLVRQIGKPAFSSEEIEVLRYLHDELARLWRRPDPLDIHSLPPRQREVLTAIRRGDTRKGIARKMGISVHTVHSYEKSLFDKAGVKSRGELLASVTKLLQPSLL